MFVVSALALVLLSSLVRPDMTRTRPFDPYSAITLKKVAW
ncbi:hypothetical protein MC7420_328 [Coleofasciculus chthonoplastes PCC 7420]|uniref:Uncharacterized protein n=1 Tax=Coleofasciculus chthonoplastes PCC 7420 TaxID=118168 RepID=B4VLT5_9CYAN|nr:hypothetical protein MC7420_328 [Coleofasciculus chthonoplastes PCC 7420]